MSRAPLNTVIAICLAHAAAMNVSADPWFRPNGDVASGDQRLSPNQVFADQSEGSPIRLANHASGQSPVVNLAFETDSVPAVFNGQIQKVSLGCANDQCIPGGGLGAGAAGGRDQTWVLVAPYVWAPAMKGSIGVNGNQQNIDLTLSDLIDIIPDLNGAAMGHVEVGKGRRGLIFDAMILDVTISEPGPVGTVFVDSNLTILELLGMYRVLDLDTGRQTLSHVQFDLLGGARYYQVQGGLRGPIITAEQSESWADFVIGGRGAVTITPGLNAFGRADIGGFGIGTSSKLAWNLDLGVEYACASCPGTSLVLGYRILDIDASKYSGAERFVFDVKMQGPFAALAFRF